jgi:hypothetical protein
MKRILLFLSVLILVASTGYAQYTPKVRFNGYPQFFNQHQDSVGVLRNTGTGVAAYGKVRLGEIDTAAMRIWLGPIAGGSADGNNYTSGISFTNQRLTLTRLGLSSLTADIDTGFLATVRSLRDSLTTIRSILDGKQASGSYALTGHTHAIGDITSLSTSLSSKLNISDTASMLSGYQRAGVSGLPSGGTTGQVLTKAGSSSEWATIVFPPTTVSDVTSLQDSLNAVRNGAVPTARTITINGVAQDLTANRSWTISTGVGSVAWGSITGTLSSQTDLQNALNGKASSTHTHPISDVTNLQTALDGKAATTHSHVIADVTNLQTTLNGKVNISDTATMLSPYLRSAAAAATYQPIGSYATTTQNNLKLNISDTSSMLSGYQRNGLIGLPSGGTTGQSLFKTGGGYEWATPTYPPTTVSDVTGLQDSLNVVRNAAVPTSRTLTINGTTFDLTANRSWTVSGSVAWGGITGTLSSQTDLQSALDGKAASSHTHTIANVTGLQTALDGKEPVISAGTTAQYWRGDKTWQTLDKSAVGLANVDNTSDLSKPVSTATQTALNGKANTSHTHPQSDITNLTTDLAGKQATLVSGSNIKTINGSSVLGSGDIVVSGSAAWGSITGTLSSQTDLQSALNGKANTSHTHAISDVTTLQTELDNRTLVGHSNLRLLNTYTYFNEFINTVTTSSAGHDVQATNNGTGAASSAQATTATNRIGLLRATTGSTATGRTSVSSAASAMRFGGGTWSFEADVNVTTLSNSTERFQLVIGFFDGTGAANQTDGAYFLYDEGGVSTSSTAAAYWQTCTVSNSVRSFNTSLVQTTVNAAQWYRLRIEVNAAANSIGFYIDGNLVATHTANIPTGSGRETGFGYLLIKSVGTTARTVDFDYMSVESVFTSNR